MRHFWCGPVDRGQLYFVYLSGISEETDAAVCSDELVDIGHWPCVKPQSVHLQV